MSLPPILAVDQKAIEKWGRGTNRAAVHCLAAKIPAPEFQEIAGAVEVTFRVPVTGTPQVTPHRAVGSDLDI